MKLAITLCLFSLAAVCLGEYIFCDLTTGFGCNMGSGVFKAQYSGKHPGYQCHQKYRMQVKLNSYKHGGYKCTFWFKRPQSYRYLYSIAEDPYAKWYTSSSAYSYGYGKKARTATKAGSYHEDWSWPNALESRNAKYPWITYEMRHQKLRIQSENGAHYRGSNSLLHTPQFKTQYIGMNRRYADTFKQGSGMCYVHCYTFSKSFAGAMGSKFRVSAPPPSTDPEDDVDIKDEGQPPVRLAQASGGQPDVGTPSGGEMGEPERRDLVTLLESIANGEISNGEISNWGAATDETDTQ